MPFQWNPKEHLSLAIYFAKWLALTFPLALLVGSASALFLHMLDYATNLRHEYPAFLHLLPVAGIGIAFLYRVSGSRSEGGNNLIMDEIHKPGGGIPSRMAPLIFITTIITHLFGGSAGREGTAVQIGGSIAGGYRKIFPWLNAIDQKKLLMVGIAAGFGGVFGTPLAGAIFAVEVLAIGKLDYEAIIPTLMGAIISDWTVSLWGIHHTAYPMIGSGPGIHMEIILLSKVVIASVLFGFASVIFSELIHTLNYIFKKLIPIFWLRPVAGGIIIIALTYAVGNTSYNGLGVTSVNPVDITILSSFKDGGADPFSWLWKTIFTTITLSTGFKGGEVTPLFYIGSTLGHTIAVIMNEPVALFAAIGLLAVFAGATNTPLASSVMGIELFGSTYSLYFTVACYIAFFFSGHTGIYLSQRIGIRMGGLSNSDILNRNSISSSDNDGNSDADNLSNSTEEPTLRTIREMKPVSR
jgi:H+/Cl- antiporter ClcA